MDYEKAYKEALERAKKLYEQSTITESLSYVFPELAESEDKRIRKVIRGWIYTQPTSFFDNGISKEEILAWLEKQGEKKNKINITFEDVLALECSMKTAKITKGGDELYKILVPLYNKIHNAYLAEKQGKQKPKFGDDENSNVNDETNAPTEYGKYVDECLNEASKHFFSEGEDGYSVADLFYAGVRCGKSWLEKQSNTNETINNDELAQGVLRGAAINLITWIDYNAAEGNTCLSNTECKDIQDSLVSGDWNKIYAYIKKKLEKQGNKPKRVSIWKHWKDGIAGNRDGEPIYLIKIGSVYSISSCLSCECDYIELSELDKLQRIEEQQ